MSDIVLGRDVVIMELIGSTYYEIGCATNCAFRFKNEIIYKTTISSGGFREKRVRLSDISGSVNGLVKTGNADNVQSVFRYLDLGITRVERAYKFLFTDEDGGEKTITMNAVIESIETRGPVDGFAEFDINLEGTGGLEMDEVAPPTESTSNVDSDTWTISGGLNYIEDVRLENVDIIEVTLEGVQHDKTTGTPVGREYKYTASIGGKGRIEFDSNIVINGQKVFAIWLY